MSDFKYDNKKLEILSCRVCGKPVAELSQFDLEKGKFQTIRLSKKRLNRYCNRLKNGRWQEVNIPKGTKGGAGFVYGVNRIDKNGTIYQYSVDFNGTKKLVRKLQTLEYPTN